MNNVIENRKTLILEEKKENIRKIKEKYTSVSDDKVAEKIYHLELTSKALKTSSMIAGILFAIDLIIPDPVIGVDEVMLGGITALTNNAQKIIEKKIDNLVAGEESKLSVDEIKNLAEQIGYVYASRKSNNQREDRQEHR